MRRAKRTLVVACLVAGAAIYGPSAHAAVSASSIADNDVSTEPTAQDLAEALAGTGATVSNVSYVGDDNAAGTFASSEDTIGIASGVVLGTGDVEDVAGPNKTDFTSRANGRVGDGDINGLTGPQSGDAAALKFDFVPTGDGVSFNFVFSSEEYSEWVGSEYNDTVALYINGVNCALVNDSHVSINTVNATTNPTFFRPNEFTSPPEPPNPNPIDTEMDGLTTVLTCQAQVSPGQTNKFKLVIADVSNSAVDGTVVDLNRDSNVFVAPGVWTGGPGQPPTCVEDGLQLLDGTGIASGIVHDQLEPVTGQILPELQAAVHDVNCGVVVPLEDAIDGAG